MPDLTEILVAHAGDYEEALVPLEVDADIRRRPGTIPSEPGW
jgi:hypothetical protein